VHHLVSSIYNRSHRQDSGIFRWLSAQRISVKVPRAIPRSAYVTAVSLYRSTPRNSEGNIERNSRVWIGGLPTIYVNHPTVVHSSLFLSRKIREYRKSYPWAMRREGQRKREREMKIVPGCATWAGFVRSALYDFGRILAGFWCCELNDVTGRIPKQPFHDRTETVINM